MYKIIKDLKKASITHRLRNGYTRKIKKHSWL